MKKCLVPLFIILFSVNVFAANRYINTACSSACDGSTWAKGWATFGAVTWTRGDTYYLASGTYSEPVNIAKAESGSSWIVVKKATVADHGMNQGWYDSYANGQAVIQGSTASSIALLISNGYVEIDGATGTGNSGHGIKIDFNIYCNAIPPALCTSSGQPYTCCTNEGTGTAPDCLGGGFGVYLESGISNVYLHHIEINTCTSQSSRQTRGVHQNSYASAVKGIHLQHLYVHDASENALTFLGQQGTSYNDYGLLVEDSWIENTGRNPYPSIHGQAFQFGPGTTQRYIIIRNTVMHDILGSGHVSLLGGSKTYYMRFYNNILSSSSQVTYWVSPGFIWSHPATGTAVTDLEIYNNTIYNISLAKIDMESPIRDRISAKNNLWVNSNFTSGHNHVTTISNNDYYNNTGAGVPTGETNQKTESADPFVNSAGYDFHLKPTANAVDSGIDLSGIFTTDTEGTSRPQGAAWDIGAYEYKPLVSSSTPGVTISSQTVTNTIAGAPANFTTQSVVSFTATRIPGTANFSIPCPSLPGTPSNFNRSCAKVSP